MIIFVLLGLLSSAYSIGCSLKRTFTEVNSVYPFVLDELPYPSDFLQEVLSEKMVVLHHDSHHMKYLSSLNSYIATASLYTQLNLAKLCLGTWGNLMLQRYAGGVYNHYLYWWTLTSSSCASPAPTGKLAKKIAETWGSFPEFQTAFNYASANLFGDGWTWLCVNQDKELVITTTAFQANPLMEFNGNACYPILGIDLWEHAYYIKYTSDRTGYISNFWNILDWSMIEMFYDHYASHLEPVPF